MVRYFYGWIPLVIVGTVAVVSLPWLGLVALMFVSLVGLAALAGAIVFLPYELFRAIRASWRGRGPSPQTPALAPAKRQNA